MTRRLRLAGRALLAAVALVCTGTLVACSSITVDALPQPGSRYGDGYDIILEFANVLNLPDRANVIMKGTKVGVVDRVSATEQGAEVTARIDGAVRIASNIHAELQQATVLGDIFVALKPGAGAAEPTSFLTAGQRIPLSQTNSPPQLEETIASLANFVASGSIQRVQNTILGINRVTPERSEQVRAIAKRVSANLADLSDNVDTVDQWLGGLASTVDVMTANIPVFQYWFSEDGLRAFDFATGAGIYISTLAPSIGSIYTGGFWLVPFLESSGVALGAVQKSKWGIEEEYKPWRKLFTDMFLPADKYPAMNIISVRTADGRELTENVHDVLRMLGAVP
ncbi:MlaD family protein [Mycolicibacterium peregrinum]|uniref:MlaD family protein n=1 Tax=Mycolicibacterium TaxID=1866885 RepID=UPI003AADD48D